MVAVVQPGVAAASDHAVHVEHVAYFQSRAAF